MYRHIMYCRQYLAQVVKNASSILYIFHLHLQVVDAYKTLQKENEKLQVQYSTVQYQKGSLFFSLK